MVRPVVTATAEEAYEGLGPWTELEEAMDWHLLKFVDAVTRNLDVLNTLVRDTDERMGWSLLLDADNAPVEYLPHMGQFVGVPVELGLSEADQRRQVKETKGFRRGRPDSMRAAAQLYLTGTKTVIIDERDTSPYHLTVRTFTAETPDAAKVEAALLSEKPAGLVMDYVLSDGLTWDEIAASSLTYDELTELFPTSDAMKHALSI